jgi:hypothetical protein
MCESVVASGSTLFVGYRGQGMRVLDFPGGMGIGTRPAVRSWQVRTRSSVRDLLKINQLLLVANDEFGVELYDTPPHRLPRLIDEVEADGPESAAQASAIHKDTVYVASWNSGVKVFQITARKGRVEELEVGEK